MNRSAIAVTIGTIILIVFLGAMIYFVFVQPELNKVDYTFAVPSANYSYCQYNLIGSVLSSYTSSNGVVPLPTNFTFRTSLHDFTFQLRVQYFAEIPRPESGITDMPQDYITSNGNWYKQVGANVYSVYVR